MKTIVQSLILLLWIAAGSITTYGQQTDNVDKIIAYGRERLLAVTDLNNKNDKAGLSSQNQYIVSLHTADVLGNGDENMDREFIKQKSLSTSTGQGSFFIGDATDLDKLNGLLKEQNSKSDIKTYLLFVDYVPMVYKKVLPASTTLGSLLKGSDKADSIIAQQATDVAASIIDAITQPFIDAQKGTQLLYCGFLKFKVYENSSVSRRNFNVYYPRNNVENGEAGNIYQNILSYYIQSVKFYSNNKVGFVSNMITALGNNNRDYKTLLALVNDGSFLQISSPDKMEEVLKTVDANAFSGLPANYRIHALKVLSAGAIPDNREVIIDQLLESVRNGNDADAVLAAMRQPNDKVPDKIVVTQSSVTGGGANSNVQDNPKKGLCLLQCITEEVGDKKLGIYGGDNYQRLIKSLIDVCYLSPTFKKQAKDLNDNYLNATGDNIPDRVIFYTYNSFWSKVSPLLTNSNYVTTPKIDWNVSYLRNCGLEVQKELFFSYLTPNTTLSKKVLNPFEPIVFENKADLGLLTELNETSVPSDHIVPAIILKYADDKAWNETTSDATMAAIDAASLATGYGELKAGITGIRKAWILFDMVNAGINLSVNASAYDDPKIKELLGYYNLATGGIALTRMGTGAVRSVKNYYTALKAEQTAMSAVSIRNFLKSVKDNADNIKDLKPEDAAQINVYLQKLKAEAKARALSNLEGSVDDAVAAIGKAAKQDWVADLFKNADLAAFKKSLQTDASLRKFGQYLSIEEEAVIKYYTTPSGYKDFNRALRGEIPMTDFYKDYERALNQALNKLPKSDRTVYRGLGKEGSEYFKTLKKGDEFTEVGFTSSSLEDDIAEHFMTKNGGNTVLIWKSKSGVLISETSEASFESEVLFKSNKRFKIVDKTFKARYSESDPLVQEIYLEEIE
jgi:hypothetical protein